LVPAGICPNLDGAQKREPVFNVIKRIFENMSLAVPVCLLDILETP
jgi:hypothetical protein